MAFTAGEAFIDVIPVTTNFNALLSAKVAPALAAVKRQGVLAGAAMGAAFLSVGVLAAKGLGQAISAAKTYGEQVFLFQQATGLAADESSKLLFATQSLGIEQARLSVGFGLLAKNIANGTNNLGKYNIATTDSLGNQLSLTDILLNLSDKYQELGGSLKGAALAQNAFGRSGRSFIPILALGRQGIEALMHDAEKFGLVLSQATVDNAHSLSIAQRQLSLSFKGLEVQIGATLLPVVLSLVKGFTALLNLLHLIPPPLLTAGIAFIGLTSAMLGLRLVAAAVASAWGPLVAAFTTGAVATQTVLPGMEALAGGTVAATAGFASLAASAAGVVIPLALVGGLLVVLKKDSDAAHEAFQAGVNKDFLALSQGATKASLAVRALALQTAAQQRASVANVPQFTRFGGFEQAVALHRVQVASDEAAAAVARYRDIQQALSSKTNELTGSLRKAFVGVDDFGGAISNVAGASDKLLGIVDNVSGGFANFTRVSGIASRQISSDILKVVTDDKASITDTIAAFQNAIAQSKDLMAQWKSQIVDAFGGAGTALEHFADLSHFSFNKATNTLGTYIQQIHQFGRNVADIEKTFGDKAARFIEFASSQGLSFSGLVAKVADGSKKASTAFLTNFNQAGVATSSLAGQITSSLDPAFDRIILQLKNVVRAIRGMPLLKINTTGAQRAIQQALDKLRELTGHSWVVDVRGNFDPKWGGPKPAASGFHGMVTRPTLFLAGEAGAERVDVTPGGRGGGGGSGQLSGRLQILDWHRGIVSLQGELDWAEATAN